MLNQIIAYLISLVGSFGYIGVFLVVTLEYICIPIPSEIVLPFVGMSIPQTNLEFLPAFLLSIGAGIFGSLLCYWLGLYGGKPLLDKFVKKNDAFRNSYDTFNNWFNKYGRWAVFLGRILPVSRTYISLFAGFNRMNMVEFCLYSAAGVGLWNLFLMGLGFFVGDNWEFIDGLLSTYSNFVIVLAVLVLIGYCIIKFNKKQQHHAS